MSAYKIAMAGSNKVYNRKAEILNQLRLYVKHEKGTEIVTLIFISKLTDLVIISYDGGNNFRVAENDEILKFFKKVLDIETLDDLYKYLIKVFDKMCGYTVGAMLYEVEL